MKLCMFSPRDQELERGWPGRIDGEKVIQLAAQTLQAFFTGGGTAREHAEYPLADVVFRAPVLHPPSVRIFDDAGDFAFANPTAIHGPDDEEPRGARRRRPSQRLACDHRGRRRDRRIQDAHRVGGAGAVGREAADFASRSGRGDHA